MRGTVLRLVHRFLKRAIAAAIVGGLLGSGCSSSSGVAGGPSKVRLDTANDPSVYGATVYVDGSVDESMYDAIVRTVGASRSRRIMLHLNSTGGLTKAGFKIVDYLKRLKRDGYTLTTYVDSTCSSMCIPIFMQGQIRMAMPRSRWVFHDASNSSGTDQRDTARILNILSESGADRDFLYDLILTDVFVGGHWTTYSGERLVAEQTNIVTDLVEPSREP